MWGEADGKVCHAWAMAVSSLKFLAVLAASSLVALVVVPGCGSDDAGPAPFAGDGGGSDAAADGKSGNDTICLQNNCDTDRHCADCSGGRTVCNQKEHRCVACGAAAGGKGCGTGQYCTKYGDCVPNGVTCAEDPAGAPQVACKSNADCGACGPNFRVCNVGTQKCVGCSATDTTNCQSTDVCTNETCVPACPSECKTDGDCGQCGAPGKEAHACNRHVCAQCSPTAPCPGGDKCDDHGVCVKRCGLGNKPGKTTCLADADCAGCKGTTKCKLPVNGGEGVCVAPATGCSDLGKGVLVLPPPFDTVTNTCSNDADCANVSADLNVGKILRDVTGVSAIKDASVPYGMRVCGAVDVLDKSCGLCVPCKVDTDCQDIDVQQVAGDAFGPVGSIASAILLDKAFGPNDRKIHLYCQNVAGNYGACVPCPNLLARCAVGGEVPPTGACDHDVCAPGGPLGVQCDPCVAEVCAKDSYCCTKEWDLACKVEVDQFCTKKTCEPDKCVYRQAGWFCFTDGSKGGYRCDGTTQTVAEGRQCPNANGTTYCQKSGPNVKDTAVLCQTEGEPGCGPGTVGKPKCFPTP